MKVISLLVCFCLPALAYSQVAAPASQTSPPSASPIPSSSPGLSQPSYPLGPGDTLKVTVWTGNEYLQDNLTVAPDGTMFIPFFVNKLIGVSGLTSTRLRDVIQSELQTIFLKPAVQLFPIGFESQKAFLVGEVQSAGHFSIFGNTRILDFVVQHGGFSTKANLASVQVTRGDGSKISVNIYDIVLKGDPSQNVPVAPGDIVFVPSLETVGKRYFVLGEVRAPQVVQSAEDLTLLDVIARAGTIAPSGEAQHVFVVRQDPGGNQVLEINFSDLYKKGDLSRNVPLRNGDVVYVPKNRRTRIADALAAVNPVLQFVRDTILLADFFARK